MTAASGSPRPGIAAWAKAPIVLNAVLAGYSSVGLPLFLAGAGASKVLITMVFTVNAVTATALNLWLAPALRKHGNPAGGLAALCAAVAAGFLLLDEAKGHAPTLFLGSALIMCLTMIYPAYIGILAATAPNRSGIIAAARRLFVVSYLAGLGLFSITTAAGVPFPVVASVVAVATAAAVATRPRTLRPVATATGDLTVPDVRTPTRRVVCLVCAVLLMKASDALRMVYLPLVASAVGVQNVGISVLFGITTIGEILVLTSLARAADRFGSSQVMTGVAVVGLCSFAFVGLHANFTILALSQLVYAVFAAGFQSVGMVVLGENLRSGIGGGASLYTALVQVGTLVGVVVPLVVPGYSPQIFYIASAFCLVAGVLFAFTRLPAAAPVA